MLKLQLNFDTENGRNGCSSGIASTNNRIDCGYPGMDSNMCLGRGCCWSPSTIPGANWCFFHGGGKIKMNIHTSYDELKNYKYKYRCSILFHFILRL